MDNCIPVEKFSVETKTHFVDIDENILTLDAFQSYFPSITSPQWNQLQQLSVSLTDWNSKVNVISRKDISAIVPNHLIPSMAICLFKQFKAGESIIDVGTGGGNPFRF